jgi:hypothetical protein
MYSLCQLLFSAMDVQTPRIEIKGIKTSSTFDGCGAQGQAVR